MVKKKTKSLYFAEREENAVVLYNQSNDKEEKNKIYTTILMPAINKMAESIIRRYKLFIPEEEYLDTYNDCISHVITKMEKFNPATGKKAYSYLGTICKNYLLFRLKQSKVEQEHFYAYDDYPEQYEEDDRFVDEEYVEDTTYEKIMADMQNKIKAMIDHKEEYNLSEPEVIVGKALNELFENWEEIFYGQMCSNKLTKSVILMFLKDVTFMETKDIRKHMKKYKEIYANMKSSFENDD